MNADRKSQDPKNLEGALEHRELLKNWLRQRFPLVEDAEDIVQEAYARLFKCHSTGPIVNVRAFLFVTARNLALNRIRRIGYEQRSTLLPDAHYENLDSGAPSPRQVACNNEAVALLTEAIRKLPPRCRQVFTLRKIYGLSQREIAEKLGISVNTVQVQGVLGLKKCREFFRKKGILNQNFE